MSIDDVALLETEDAATAADMLVSGLVSRQWGQVSLSVYETGRLVTLAPWLTGHTERVEYLLATQRSDGSWGAPDGYGLVPTLSATEAILSSLSRGDSSADPRVLTEAADRGLRVLGQWLDTMPASSLPDMPAIEVIVPSLVELINQHLAEDARPTITRLRLPAGMSDALLSAIRQRLRLGADVPEKLLHALEVAGDAVGGASGIRPTPMGTVGASPAATAAWLGGRALLHANYPARRYLEAVARCHGGPVPVGLPITVFERGWVLSWLTRAGIPLDVPPEMVADLRAAIRPAGTPAGAGLPPDADTTSVALYALALLGVPYEPESLWAFETETHFCTWPGEQGFSVSVNAHVLDAFGRYFAKNPNATTRYADVIAKLTAVLRDAQRLDGSWMDRWHASPYYATVSCALALDEFGGADAAITIRRAVQWILDSQHEDGSWGRWTGTLEETAYAMQVLLMTRARSSDPRCTEAAARGYAFLRRSKDVVDDPPLWHDKDLYQPIAVVRAAVLASSYLAQRNPAIVAFQTLR